MQRKSYAQEQYTRKELLRLTTAGSVDDGKSTLIGRLLFDSKATFQDQIDNLKNVSAQKGEDTINLALLTDGLRAEREQGITIDVAYRYFSTPKRKFIIADSPGHEQYTRNMVTGASTADLGIILVDARKGIVTQSRRHGLITSLLGIQHIIVAVNKMDAVDYSYEVFENIVKEYKTFSKKLDIHDITFIPICALHGDNIVTKSKNMSWYDGPTIIHHLENVMISSDKNLIDFRLPVQYVIRPHQDFRGFSGRIASGSIKKGETVIVLPSLNKTTVKEIIKNKSNSEEAEAGESIVLTLNDEVDVSRGNMIVREHNIPEKARIINATICWMDHEKEMNVSSSYILQHTTNHVKAIIRELHYLLDVNTLHRINKKSLYINEIGRVELELLHPIFIDTYKINRETGSFILIDPNSNQTVAAGMIINSIYKKMNNNYKKRSLNVIWENSYINREHRELLNGHKGHCYWFTGLSGSGKSTLAKELQKHFFKSGKLVYHIDGDNIRHGLCGDLDFSYEDRKENIRRVAHVAQLMYDAGLIVICSFISPSDSMRKYARSLFPKDSFSEIYINSNLGTCIKRDPKGLYKKALDGEIRDFTGLTSKYEKPENPEIELNTESSTVEECLLKIISKI